MVVPYNKWVASHKVGYILILVNTLFTFAVDEGGGGYSNIVITVIGYIILIITVLCK